jgi:hypothetical protein
VRTHLNPRKLIELHRLLLMLLARIAMHPPNDKRKPLTNTPISPMFGVAIKWRSSVLFMFGVWYDNNSPQ